MATRVPGRLGRVLLPQMNELKGEVRALDAKVDGGFKATRSEIRRLDEKADLSNRSLEGKIDALDRRMDVAQRVAVIEEKIRGFEARK